MTKSINLDAKLNLNNFSIKLTQQLRDFYTKEGLSLLGGFVDKANKLQLLFFKLDANSGYARNPPNIFADTWAPAADGQ